VARLARFGIVVELGDGIEGLVHVTELAAHPITDPAEVATVGEIVRAKVLRVDVEERKIGLSLKRIAV
jgi:small subunit ribosomal protein S1